MNEIPSETAVTQDLAFASRDVMFARIMAAYLGADGAFEILSTSDVSGGNNSISLRRHDLTAGKRRFAVIEKMPSISPASRVGLNVRELWLYDRVLTESLNHFSPKFYGSCTHGALMQWVFAYIEGVRPSLGSPSASRRVLATLGEVNALAIPEACPFEREAIAFMAPEKIRRRLDLLTQDRDLAVFHRDLPVHAARYDGMKKGLSHGDLHRGNLLLDRNRRVFLIDWSRWGMHPVGSDFGKYLIGYAYRDKTPLRKHLRDYARAVSTELDDVVFSARYTRVGFLLSLLAGKGRKVNPEAVGGEILHHAAAIGNGQ